MAALKEAIKFNINQAKEDPIFNKTFLWALISFISVVIAHEITTYCAANIIIKEAAKEQEKIAKTECESAMFKEEV